MEIKRSELQIFQKATEKGDEMINPPPPPPPSPSAKRTINQPPPHEEFSSTGGGESQEESDGRKRLGNQPRSRYFEQGSVGLG